MHRFVHEVVVPLGVAAFIALAVVVPYYFWLMRQARRELR